MNVRSDQIKYIKPGKSLDRQTFITHPFIVKGSIGKCYGIYTAKSLPSLIKN